MTATTTRKLEQAALDLAGRGYHVFPVRPRAKTPITGNGFKDATRDERKILHWWDRNPTANIGIACEASGIAVLDIDSKHGANPAQVLQGRDLNGAPVIRTGQAPKPDREHPKSLQGVRGAQVYFRGHLLTGPLTGLDGCEIRGDRAYIVAPPSIHPSGVAYQGDLPAAGELPEVPAWLAEVAGASHGPREPAPPAEEIIPPGQRNQALTQIAGAVRRRGMDADEIMALLVSVNERRCRPPLPRDELESIAHSVERYAPADSVVQHANGTEPAADRYAVTLTDKGKLKLPPPAFVDDISGHCAWLTSVFALHPAHPIIRGARQGSRSAEAHVALFRHDAPSIRFEPASRVNTPQRLKEDITWQTLPSDGATPSFSGEHCAQIAHVIKMLCKTVEQRDQAEETAGIVGSYLATAVAVEGRTTYGNGRERYAAAEALQRELEDSSREPVGPPRYLLDENTGEIVIPLDELQTAARKYVGGSLARGWLDARMEDLGWSRITLDGHGHPGRGGRSQGRHLRRDVYRGHLPRSDDA